mmetsp:Transcript_36450/g.85516  ORF Transcript_36450/g.85516 Transcript_36450/m.85516 type:complete len:466 (+) Transcript_36450:354-1751(+)
MMRMHRQLQPWVVFICVCAVLQAVRIIFCIEFAPSQDTDYVASSGVFGGKADIHSLPVEVAQFFMSEEEEEREVEMGDPQWASMLGFKRVPPLAQPIGFSDKEYQIFPSLWEMVKRVQRPAICLHWQQIEGHGSLCHYRGKQLMYTWPKNDTTEWFQCHDPFDQPQDTRTSKLSKTCDYRINDTMRVLYYPGPTWIQARNAHLPHFLEMIALGAYYLQQHGLDTFPQVLVETSNVIQTGSANMCPAYDGYVPGYLAPKGSPIAQSLQYTLLTGISSSILSAWSVKPGTRVCLGDAKLHSHNADGENGLFPDWFLIRIAEHMLFFLVLVACLTSNHSTGMRRYRSDRWVSSRSVGCKVLSSFSEQPQEVAADPDGEGPPDSHPPASQGTARQPPLLRESDQKPPQDAVPSLRARPGADLPTSTARQRGDAIGESAVGNLFGHRHPRAAPRGRCYIRHVFETGGADD